MLFYLTYGIKHEPIKVWRWSHRDDFGNKLLIDTVQEAWNNGIDISDVNYDIVVQKANRFDARHSLGSTKILIYGQYIWFFAKDKQDRIILIGLSKLSKKQQNCASQTPHNT